MLRLLDVRLFLSLIHIWKVRNEYIEDDGRVSVGDYDMVPLIDRFVEKHPDFSYRGAKGIVALTGYNGILGYLSLIHI